MLRHLPHPGRGDGSLHGGMGRRRDEEVRLPQIPGNTVTGVDDFASMREIIYRRYKRVKDEEKPMPSLVLIDGGLGQCTRR